MRNPQFYVSDKRSMMENPAIFFFQNKLSTTWVLKNTVCIYACNHSSRNHITCNLLLNQYGTDIAEDIAMSCIWHIEAEAVWLSFCKQHLKYILLTENIDILIEILLKSDPKGPINICHTLVLMMASSRRQAIISANYGAVYRRIYASLGLDELSHLREYP